MREKKHFELWALLRRGEAQEQVALWTAKSGKELWVHSRYAPLTDEVGTVAEVVQIVCDVTADKKREAEERNQIAAISHAHAIASFKLDGTVLDANAVFLSIMGYDIDEIRGQHHSKFCDGGYTETPEYQEFWQT